MDYIKALFIIYLFSMRAKDNTLILNYMYTFLKKGSIECQLKGLNLVELSTLVILI